MGGPWTEGDNKCLWAYFHRETTHWATFAEPPFHAALAALVLPNSSVWATGRVQGLWQKRVHLNNKSNIMDFNSSSLKWTPHTTWAGHQYWFLTESSKIPKVGIKCPSSFKTQCHVSFRLFFHLVLVSYIGATYQLFKAFNHTSWSRHLLIKSLRDWKLCKS